MDLSTFFITKSGLTESKLAAFLQQNNVNITKMQKHFIIQEWVPQIKVYLQKTEMQLQDFIFQQATR